MNFCYAIKDWQKHFENSESRKVKSLTWVPVKNKHDGKGYRRVVQHPKSVQVFCAWNLILQVASKMPTRGLLRDEDGPLQPSDLADMTGFPLGIFEVAFEVLQDPRIGWLVQDGAENTRTPPAASGRDGVEGNRTELNGTEKSSDKASKPERNGGGKLSPAQVELAKSFENLLNGQWVNDAGKWINRIKSQAPKVQRVMAEVDLARREQRIHTTPAQYAEQIWQEFK